MKPPLGVTLNSNALEEISLLVTEHVFPFLVDHTENLQEEKWTEEGKAGNDQLNVFAKTSVGGFWLEAPTKDDITISATQEEGQSIKFRIRTNNIKSGFSNIGAEVGFTMIVPITCSIGVRASVSLPLEVDIKVELKDDGITFVSGLDNVNVQGAALFLTPIINLDVCAPISAILGLVGTALGGAATALGNLVFPFIQDSFTDFFSEAWGQPNISLPQSSPEDVGEGSLRFFFDWRELSAKDDNMNLFGSLRVQAWKRDQTTYEPQPNSGHIVPSPSADNLLNINFLSTSVDVLIGGVWYLIVQPVEEELPDILASLVKIAFPSVSSHSMFVTVDLPQPTFVGSGTSVEATILLKTTIFGKDQGNSKIIVLEASSKVRVPISLPTFNEDTKVFEDLTLEKGTGVEDISIETPTKPAKGKDWERDFEDKLVQFINDIVDNALAPLNKEVNLLLGSSPLAPPPIVFPALNTSLSMDASRIELEVHEGLISAGGDLTLRFENLESAPGSKVRALRPASRHLHSAAVAEETVSFEQRFDEDILGDATSRLLHDSSIKSISVYCEGPSRKIQTVLGGDLGELQPVPDNETIEPDSHYDHIAKTTHSAI